MAPSGNGKRKIEIKKIEKPKGRIVTFSKRRQGLFKKAQDYANVTGSQIAVLVFSPAGNPYVHGSPSFEAVVEKYLNGASQEDSGNVSGFLMGLEDKMKQCRNKEDFATAKAELEEVRGKVLRRLKQIEEEEFIDSLLNF